MELNFDGIKYRGTPLAEEYMELLFLNSESDELLNYCGQFYKIRKTEISDEPEWELYDLKDAIIGIRETKLLEPLIYLKSGRFIRICTSVSHVYESGIVEDFFIIEPSDSNYEYLLNRYMNSKDALIITNQ